MTTIPEDAFFEIRINSVTTGVPLAFDLYLVVNWRPTLFRKRGEKITPERIKLLHHHGARTFLVPKDQRSLYQRSLRDQVRDPSSSTEVKCRFIKESAFLHVHDLFTKKDILPVVNDVKNLVEEMVTIISTDVTAVTSLMRLSVHDYYTYNHCVNVSVYSIALAKRIFGDEREALILTGLGGLLHDLGKRKLRWELINKSAALTPEEWKEIRRHPEYGREFLEHITSIPDGVKLVVFEHHENYDGTGYPRGLKANDISKLARVVAIADVFDALTTDRSYHKAISAEDALNMMFAMQPGKFDPNLFLSFNRNLITKGRYNLAKDFDPCRRIGAIVPKS